MRWEICSMLSCCLLRSGGCWLVVGGVWSLPPVPQSADAAPQLAPQCRPLWSPCGPTCGQHCHLFLFSRGLSHIITSSQYGDSPSLLPAYIINIHCAPEREREVGLAWPGLVDNRCSSLVSPSSSASLLSDLERNSSWDERAGILL